jgi:hypothetical protein
MTNWRCEIFAHSWVYSPVPFLRVCSRCLRREVRGNDVRGATFWRTFDAEKDAGLDEFPVKPGDARAAGFDALWTKADRRPG